jgi:hypothetical protein
VSLLDNKDYRGRKFNIGRQGEQLLNKEFHDLFMTLKYLNFERYENIEDMNPERQTSIPDHALRVRLEKNIDFLQAYYPGENVWKNFFEGYYHPINTGINAEENVIDRGIYAPYQLGIDTKTGALHYWDSTANDWVLANAGHYDGSELNHFSGLNFQFISPLKSATTKDGGTFYPVPFIKFGKLFSNETYINIESGDVSANDCAIIPPAEATGRLSWVHINAKKLIRVDKRLLEVQKDANKVDYKFIGITSTQSEFYGFNAGNPLGKLMHRGIDFKDVLGGIELLNTAKYDYIYAITYGFDENPHHEGLLLSDTSKIGEKNEIYVGQVDGRNMALFMDGLSLEQSDENDYTIYDYDDIEGTIKFKDDDADVINEMQMTTLLFPQKTEEFTISNKGANVSVNGKNKTVSVEVGNNISGWKTPMAFVSGLGLQETEIFDDIEVINNKIVIHDFVLPGNEIVKGYVADVGDSFVCKGKLNKPYIVHKDIVEDERYCVFVNGILLTPTNGDISVKAGRIDINNADNVRFDNLDYVVFDIEDDNDNKIALVFDETISYYSVRIDDGGIESTYNDCNAAIVYITDTRKAQNNGILLDQAAIDKPINEAEGYYKAGQIIRVADDYGNYKYYKYDYLDSDPVEISKEQEEIVSELIGYYATQGSIHLLGDNEALEGASLTYFAYNFANMIDEVAIHGKKTDLPIHVSTKQTTHTYNGSASRLNSWRAGCNSLSTYINGLILENKETEVYEGLTRKYELKVPDLLFIPNEYYGEKNLLAAINGLYNIYKDKFEEYKALYKSEHEDADDFEAEENAHSKIFETEDITKWVIINNEIAKDYFSSLSLCRDALELAIYFNEDMQEEQTSYIIEKIERGERVAAHRDYIYLETGKDNNHSQIVRTIQDTIQTDFLLAPGTVNVYLNGALLPYEDYCKFDNNRVMFNVDVCGLQQLPKASKMIESLPDHLNEKEYEEYSDLLKKKQVTRIITDKAYYVPTTSRDTIMVERRSDTSIKTITYDILDISYPDAFNASNERALEFSQDFYDIPDSLINSGDFIKIYINGILYDNGYTVTRDNGRKSIKLKDISVLKMDPIRKYFDQYPEKEDEYIQEFGGKYRRTIDRITFEWR